MKNILHVPINAKRVYGLDILRAVAIMSVLYGHSGIFLRKHIRHWYNLLAFDGVSIFFVLSGFLIGGILIRTIDNNKISFATLLNFWKNRWLRTIPPYMFVLCLLAVIWAKQHNWHFDSYILQYFIFSQNIVKPNPEFFPESWSLSVEEWFYLLVPVIMFICCRFINPRKCILAIAVFIIAAVTAYRYIKAADFYIDEYNTFDANFRKIVVLRIDSIMYGLIGAYMAYYRKDFWLKHKGLKLVVGIILFILYHVTLNTGNRAFNVYDTVFSFSIASVGTLFTLPYLSTLLTGEGLMYKTITKISLISYSLYLLNYSFVIVFICQYLLKKLHLSLFLNNIIGYLLFWSVTIICSILMYKFIELPAMNLRHRKKTVHSNV